MKNSKSVQSTIKELLVQSSLTRMAQIQLLSELLNERVNHCINDNSLQIPDYVEPILTADNFPMSSADFKRELMDVMPPMRTKESKERKALRLINKMKEGGTITSDGGGSLTTYYYTG